MFLRFVRWWIVLLGGLLLGAGLCLHGQIAVAREMRRQVQGTFFLWRGLGQATFIFQDDQTRTALWLNEVPDEVMKESDSTAWTLVVIGGLMALAAPLVRRRQRRA